MALNNPTNKNNNKKNYLLTISSNYRMSNENSKLEATALLPSFFNKMLKLSIAVMEAKGDGYQYNEDKGLSVYLTHTKARMLAYELRTFLTDRESYNNMGVISASSIISISNGKEYGLSYPILTIKQIDLNGKTTASISYEFRNQFHYTVRNFDEATANYDKQYYDDLEILQLIDLLEQYYLSMTNALPYAIAEQNKYDMSRLNTKSDLIMEKLGIEKQSNYSSSKPSESFFSKNDESSNSSSSNSYSSSFRSSSIDDIASQIGE